MNATRFFLYNVLVLVGLSIGYVLVMNARQEPYNPVVPALFVGFLLLNQLFRRMLIKAHAKSPQRFITAFLGVVGIKLMSAMVFLLVYLLATNDPNIISVAIALFAAYMSYTILLVRAALLATPAAK
jgi:hypothetical protein